MSQESGSFHKSRLLFSRYVQGQHMSFTLTGWTLFTWQCLEVWVVFLISMWLAAENSHSLHQCFVSSFSENGSYVVRRNKCSLPLCAEKCTYLEAYVVEQNLIDFRDKIANEKARKGVTNELLFRVGKHFCNPVPPTTQSSCQSRFKFTFANCVKHENLNPNICHI